MIPPKEEFEQRLKQESLLFMPIDGYYFFFSVTRSASPVKRATLRSAFFQRPSATRVPSNEAETADEDVNTHISTATEELG